MPTLFTKIHLDCAANMTPTLSTVTANIQANLSNVHTWIFDLDNTLYRADAKFFKQIDQKMTAFIQSYLNVSEDEATRLRKTYWSEHGTTLSGLMNVHKMDPTDFLADVHDVDLKHLKPDPKLRALISALPGRKLIFTNGSRGHAENVGTHLNLFDLFDGSFGIEDTGYIPKPKRAAFEVFNSRFDVDPKGSIFFEDGIHNLRVPKEMGMNTVLVTSDSGFDTIPEAPKENAESVKIDWVDYVTDDLTAWLGVHAPQ